MIEEPPWRTPPARVGDQRAEGAGDVDAEMLVEAAWPRSVEASTSVAAWATFWRKNPARARIKDRHAHPLRAGVRRGGSGGRGGGSAHGPAHPRLHGVEDGKSGYDDTTTRCPPQAKAKALSSSASSTASMKRFGGTPWRWATRAPGGQRARRPRSGAGAPRRSGGRRGSALHRPREQHDDAGEE